MIRHLHHRQKGAAMVEMALVISIFLSLIFAVFEFSLAIFYAARLSEATRVAARSAVVNNSIVDDIHDRTCDDIAAQEYLQCDAGKCVGIIKAINNIVDIDPTTIFVRYQCTTTGYTKAAGFTDSTHEIYSITVKLQGVVYQFIMPGILGLHPSITMPSFETTRLSEDLWSQSE